MKAIIAALCQCGKENYYEVIGDGKLRAIRRIVTTRGKKVDAVFIDQEINYEEDEISEIIKGIRESNNKG